MRKANLIILLCKAALIDLFASDWNHSMRSLIQFSDHHNLSNPGKRFHTASETRLRHSLVQLTPKGQWHFALESAWGMNSIDSRAGGTNLNQSFANQSYVLTDLTHNFKNQPHSSFSLKVDRMVYSFSHQDYDVSIGRQPLSIGRSRYFQVLDVINPFAPQALDTSYKPGIDALSISKALNPTDDLQLIITGSSNGKGEAYLLRYRHLLNSLDLEWVGGRVDQRTIFGLGFEGEIGSQALFGEIGVFETRSRERILNSSAETLKASLGLEWRLGRMQYFSLSWLYNGFGVKDPMQLGLNLATGPVSEGFAYLGMREYLNLSYNATVNLKDSVTLNWTQNLRDQAAIVQPQFNRILSRNLDVTIFAYHGFGSPNSEFGSAGTGAGIFLRVFF